MGKILDLTPTSRCFSLTEADSLLSVNILAHPDGRSRIENAVFWSNYF